MGVRYNTSIVTNGLILCLDAANTKSYPGSGSTWTDISGNGNNATLFNSPTYSNGLFTFNGTNQYASVTSLNLSSGTSTIIGATRYSGSTNGRIISSMSNNWLMGHWSNSVANYYAEGWVSAVSAGGSDTQWRIYAGTGNTSSDSWELYINGALNVSNNSGAQGPNGICIGAWQGTSEFSACQCAFVIAYNRVLTAEEIRQNFNALRGRYGI